MSKPEQWQDELARHGLLPPPWQGSDLEVNARCDYAAKYRGTLVGIGIGDALGREVEGWGAATIQDIYGTLRDYVVQPPGEIAEITDDTSLTVAAAQSIVENGRLEPEDLARRFSSWWPVSRGIGGATHIAIKAFGRGMPWWRAGDRSAGNGAAMRIAPIGLLHPVDVDGLRRDAALAAVITHADQMAVASAIAQSWIVAYLLHVEPGHLDVGDFFAGLSRVLEDVVDSGHPDAGDPVGPPVQLRTRLLAIADRLDDSTRDLLEFTGTSGFVLESLPGALACFLRSPLDPEEVIVSAVNAGGDTDTVAAMAGALAGAYLGESAFPTRWLEPLEYVDGLEALGDRLFEMSGLPGDAPDWRTPGAPAEDAYAPTTIDGREYPTLTHLQCAAAADDAALAERLRLVPVPSETRRLAAKLDMEVDVTRVDVGELSRRLRDAGAGDDTTA